MTDHGTAQWPEIGLGARDQLYRGGKKSCKFEKRCANTTGGGSYIIHAHAKTRRGITVVFAADFLSPLVFFLLTVDLAMGAMNRLQAYMVTFAVMRCLAKRYARYLENEIYEMCTVAETSSAIFAERREASRGRETGPRVPHYRELVRCRAPNIT